jgi:hypothetical protein
MPPIKNKIISSAYYFKRQITENKNIIVAIKGT